MFHFLCYLINFMHQLFLFSYLHYLFYIIISLSFILHQKNKRFFIYLVIFKKFTHIWYIMNKNKLFNIWIICVFLRAKSKNKIWKKNNWMYRGSNPRPFECKSNVIPLHHTPELNIIINLMDLCNKKMIL